MGNKNSSANKKVEFLESDFDSVKSKYILKQILDDLSQKKILEMVKYNKKIQERLDIKIDNYKEFCKSYSSIEFELKINNYNLFDYKFINIKGDESYYHFYFNNNKKEEKRKTITDKDKKILIKINHQMKSFSELFAYHRCI